MNSLLIPPQCTYLCTFNVISSLENFEVRVRVRSATGQKARVRAKVVRCEVRACGQKSVTPNTLLITYDIFSASDRMLSSFCTNPVVHAVPKFIKYLQ